MKIEYINGYKFARMSDYVFSEVLTNKQFKEINPENIEIIYSNNSHISYQKNQINIYLKLDKIKNSNMIHF